MSAFLCPVVLGITWFDRSDRALAARLEEAGVSAAVTRVLTDEHSRSVDIVTVQLVTATGETVEATLAGATVDSSTETVVYDPAAPTTAMAVNDVSYYAHDDLEGGLGTAIVLAAVPAMTTIVWLALRRPPWWSLTLGPRRRGN